MLTAFLIMLSVATSRADYYSDSQKGWWWGERTIEKKEEKKQQPAAPEKPGPQVPPSLKSAYTYDDVWNMHPDEFYELQEAYKKKAVQTLREADVQDYYELQEIARKKSLAFTNASQYVWQKNPALTVAKDYPITTPGNLSRIGMIEDERRQTLQANRDTFALVYFWKPGCSYCEDQSNILKWFQQETGWQVKRVNIAEQPGMAAKFSIAMTPTIILLKKGHPDFLPVSAGVASADEIADKTYRAVRLLNNEIAPEEYSIYEFQRGGGFDVKQRREWQR